MPLFVLTGSPFINQERFAGGLLCQDVHVASTPSPTPAFMLLGKPVILGFLSGRSVIEIYIYYYTVSVSYYGIRMVMGFYILQV